MIWSRGHLDVRVRLCLSCTTYRRLGVCLVVTVRQHPNREIDFDCACVCVACVRAKLCGCETIRLWLGAARFHDPGLRPSVRPGPCALRRKTPPLCESLLIAAKSLLIDSKSFPAASRCFALLPAPFPLLRAAFVLHETPLYAFGPPPPFGLNSSAVNRCRSLQIGASRF